MSTPIIFNGSIPQNYEDYLIPFLFDPYAEDLLQRIVPEKAVKVLELACGTGCVTKHLLAYLPATAQLTATDLEPGMLEVAKRKIASPDVAWAAVDMTAIPCKDNYFDLIVCQFGLMLVPEKLKALTEMYRVLKSGGRLIFNVWGNIPENQVWDIAGKVIESFTGINPILQDPGPFSLNENNTLQLLHAAGFNNIKTTAVNKTGTAKTAALAAKGFIEGLPVFMAISKKNPALIPQIQHALEQQLISQLGDHPMQSGLQALVFETIK